MIAFYFIACIPIVIGGVLWLKHRKAQAIEWAISSVVSLVLAGIFHLAAVSGMTKDVETWSGHITMAKHFSEWLEYYEEAIYRTEYYTETECYTDREGRSQSRSVTHSRQVFDHWEPRTRLHENEWKSYSTIDTSYSISAQKFNYFVDKFKMRVQVEGKRTTWDHNSRMISGDPYDYETRWTLTKWIEPVTKLVTFENRIKAAPTVFSFVKVPTNCPVYAWPSNNDPFRSERVMGAAARYVDTFKWDVLNAQIGAYKEVNLIIVGFPYGSSSALAELQKAKWIGGKKNDLVITFCEGESATNLPEWVTVFGWSESDICKRNLESYLLEKGFSGSFYEDIGAEVVKNYKRKDWHKFDYIKIEPSGRIVFWYVIIMIFIQGGLWACFLTNPDDVWRGPRY